MVKIMVTLSKDVDKRVRVFKELNDLSNKDEAISRMLSLAIKKGVFD